MVPVFPANMVRMMRRVVPVFLLFGRYEAQSGARLPVFNVDNEAQSGARLLLFFGRIPMVRGARMRRVCSSDVREC